MMRRFACALLLYFLQCLAAGGVSANGEWRSGGQVGVLASYNDNWLFADETTAISAGSSRANVDLDLVREGENRVITINMYGGYQAFDSELLPGLSEYGGRITHLRRTEYGATVLSGEYDVRSGLLSVFDEDGVVEADEGRERLTARLSRFRQLSESRRLSSSLQAQRIDFDDVDTIGRRSDYDVLTATLGTERQWNESTTTTLSVLTDYIESSSDLPVIFGVFVVPTQLRTRTLLAGPGLSIARNLGASWSAELTGSARWRQDKSTQSSLLGRNNTTVTRWNYFGSFSMQRQYAKGTVLVSASRDFRPAQSSFVQLARRDAVNFQWQHQLSRHLSTSWRANLFQERQPDLTGSTIDRVAWQLGTRLVWDSQSRLRVSLDLFLQEQEPSDVIVGIQRLSAALEANYRFGSRSERSGW